MERKIKKREIQQSKTNRYRIYQGRNTQPNGPD